MEGISGRDLILQFHVECFSLREAERHGPKDLPAHPAISSKLHT
jgi:hypothetical protein